MDFLAYVDPGTGALLWQLLMAGFVGLAFYFRTIFRWLKSKLGIPKQPE